MRQSNSEAHADEASETSRSNGGPDSAQGTRFEEERRELEWLLAQPEIARSASLVRFLSFVCTRYFEGETAEIREYSIAVEALGRKAATFDSHIDPIVRVTARALRKKLSEVYQADGKGRPLRIVLPLGHYIPEFVHEGERDAGPGADGPGQFTEPEAMPRTGNQVFWVRAVELARGHGGTVWKLASALAALAAVFVAGFFLGRQADHRLQPAGEGVQWGAPVWSDEFNDQTGQIPDQGKWAYQTGNQGGWGNNEIEIYCAARGTNPKGCDPRRPNVFEDGAGHLVMRAQRNPDGSWTSGRITTMGLKDFQYGRIEARIKMPVGSGLWPSFWMLGSNFAQAGWPTAGSVTIAENVSYTPRTNGLGPQMIRSTVHGPRYYGANGLWHDFRLPNGARVDDGSFHTYGVIWSPGMIQFYVDDPANVYFVQDSSDIPEGGEWVFDKPFFLVLNLAVGGDWPGEPGPTTPNPADLIVDYVRVYNIPQVPAPSIRWHPMQVKSGSSAASIVNLEAHSYAGRVHLTCAAEPATATCSLGSAVVNFSDTLSQEDTLTLSTQTFSDKGKIMAPPGRYKVTITATTMSGDRTRQTLPFEVTPAE
jgi:beta-glucanase (GH16 family)